MKACPALPLRPRAVLPTAAVLVALAAAPPLVAAPLLPDLFAWEDVDRNYIHGGTFDTSTLPGRALYRFNVAIPNIGDGPLEVREETHPDDTQDIYQRIHDSGGGVTEQLIGTFAVEDTPFGHLHLTGLARYGLREVAPGGGVGDVVAGKDKTSHCLVDSLSYDTSLPNAPPFRQYANCDAEHLGVSVGWVDLYGANFVGQWIDVTGLPDGTYWLEVSIDPDNRVAETDDTNNITQILVDLDIPPVDPLMGDMDCDGEIDFDDINAFVTGLANPGVYQLLYGVAPTVKGDLEGDGDLDFDDIPMFVALFETLQMAGLHPVAEPHGSAYILGAFFCAVLAAAARRKAVRAGP